MNLRWVPKTLQIAVAEIAYDRKASYERFAPNQTDPITSISLLLKEYEESSKAVVEQQLSLAAS